MYFEEKKAMNVIQHIGHDLFFIYIFSNYQIKLWNLYCDKTPIIFDSTSGITTKIRHAKNTKSHSLYSHLSIINCELRQYAIYSAITGKQDTPTVQGLLMRFVQAGANNPKQVVSCQFSLLITTIK